MISTEISKNINIDSFTLKNSTFFILNRYYQYNSNFIKLENNDLLNFSIEFYDENDDLIYQFNNSLNLTQQISINEFFDSSSLLLINSNTNYSIIFIPIY